jgi:hypothetical protein
MRIPLIVITVCAAFAGLGGCNLVDMSTRASTLVQVTPVYTGKLPNPWYLYTDSLYTGGGEQIWNNCGGTIEPTTDLTVNLASTLNPHGGSACIDATFSGSTCLAAQFIDTPDFSTVQTAPPKNISSGNYSKCTFWARSVPAMSTVTFYVVGNVNTNTYNQAVLALTTQWQQFSIPVTSASQLSVTNFFGFGYPNVTGDVYIDDITLQ